MRYEGFNNKNSNNYENASHERFVQEQLKPYPFVGGNNKVYAKIIQENNEGNDELGYGRLHIR